MNRSTRTARVRVSVGMRVYYEWSINPPLYPPQSISILLVDWKQSDSLLLHDGCRRILPDRRNQKGLRFLLLVYSSSFPSRAGTFVRHRRMTKQVKRLFNSRINHLVEIEHGMLLKLVGTNAKNGVRSRKWRILLLQTCTPSWLEIAAEEGNLSELDMMVYSILRRNLKSDCIGIHHKIGTIGI